MGIQPAQSVEVGPGFLWQREAVGTNTSSVMSVSLDPAENTYAVGYFTGKLKLGWATLTNSKPDNTNEFAPDLFVAKYSTQGDFQWLRQISGKVNYYVEGASTRQGVVVAGTFEGTLGFPGTSTHLSASPGKTGLFLANYNTYGQLTWARQVATLTNSIYAYTQPRLTVDLSGNIILAGNFSGTATFGGIKVSAQAEVGIYLAKYDANGNLAWVVQGDTGALVNDVFTPAADLQGNVFLAGSFNTMLHMAGTNLTGTLSDGYDGGEGFPTTDIFVAKFGPRGNPLWIQQAGGPGIAEYIYGLTVDRLGNAYVVGQFGQTITIGTTTLTNSLPFPYNQSSLFIAKYDPKGKNLWAHKGTGISGALAFSVAVNNAGEPYVTGRFGDYYPGGGGVGILDGMLYDYKSSPNAFVAKYDTLGNFLWLEHMATKPSDIYSLAISSTGNIHVGGGAYPGFYEPGIFSRALIGKLAATKAVSPPAIFDSPDSKQVVHKGSSATFAVTATGAQPMWYQWQFNGNNIPGANSSSMTLNRVQASNAGNYRVIIRNGFGSVTSSNSTLVLAPTTALPDFTWVKQGGGAFTPSTSSESVAVDELGNAYIAGSGGLLAHFDTRTISRLGEDKLFIAKYDRKGNLLWLQTATGEPNLYDYQGASRIIVDKNGNAYVTGMTGSALTFGTNSQTVYGAFTAKFDTNGRFQWVLGDGGLGMAVDTGGSVYLTTSDHIAKYDGAANLVWWESTFNFNFSDGHNIDVDAEGNFYLAGINGAGATIGEILSLPNSGIFLAKFDADRHVLWSKSGTGPGNLEKGPYLGLDKLGNTFLNGSFSDNFHFDTANLTGNTNASLFLLKYDASGQLLWARQASGHDSVRGSNLAVDESGNVYSVGTFDSTATFENMELIAPTLLTSPPFSYGSIYIAKYDSTGNLAGARQISALFIAGSPAIAINRFNEIYLTGGIWSYGSLSFGRNSLSTYTSECFLTKLGQPTKP